MVLPGYPAEAVSLPQCIDQLLILYDKTSDFLCGKPIRRGGYVHYRFHHGAVRPDPFEHFPSAYVVNPVAPYDRNDHAAVLCLNRYFAAGSISAELITSAALEAVHPFILPVQPFRAGIMQYSPPSGILHFGVGLARPIVGDKDS